MVPFFVEDGAGEGKRAPNFSSEKIIVQNSAWGMKLALSSGFWFRAPL